MDTAFIDPWRSAIEGKQVSEQEVLLAASAADEAYRQGLLPKLGTNGQKLKATATVLNN